jgi:hypothetical protein
MNESNVNNGLESDEAKNKSDSCIQIPSNSFKRSRQSDTRNP